MRRQRGKTPGRACVGIVTMALCISMSWADSSVHEVIVESGSWPTAEGFWEGPAFIWIDGHKHEGTIRYVGEGRMNKNSWHGSETHVYDFDDLGTLELSGTAKTSFEYVSPDHRWHHYASHLQVTGGTGAFEEAQGVIQFGGYTEWHIPPPPAPYGWVGGKGTIFGIQLDGAQ